MARVLYPRSDSISAKVVEPSDFEQMFSFIEDHITSGITVTAGSGLAVNISTGIIRLKGLVCEVDSTETVSGLNASEQRKMNKAVKIARFLALIPYCDNHKRQ